MSVTHFSPLRGSRLKVFCEKGVLRNFAKFTGKDLCRSLFFSNVAGPKPFPVNFAKFLRTPFIIEHLWWLLLSILNENIRKLEICLKWFNRALILLYTDSYERTQLCDSLFKESTQRCWFQTRRSQEDGH